MNIKEDYHEFLILSKEFGYKRGLKHYFYKKPMVRYRMCYEISQKSTGLKRTLYRSPLGLFRIFRNRYINLVYDFYEEIAQPVVEKYTKETFPKAEISGSKNVWICWWQGYESMPWLCRMCYDNLCKNIPEAYAIHLVTRDNYSQFVDMPDYILKRLNDGVLSITQFSDILREALLYYQGGLWLDCSVWTTPNFLRFVKTDMEFWSIKLDQIYKEHMIGQVISECKWTGFFMYGKKGNIVTKFAFDCMCEYYRKYTYTFDYFLQNFFIKIGYNNVPAIKKIIDDIPLSNSHIYAMWLVLNEPFSESYWEEMLSDTGAFKLSQKVQYKDVVNGVKTFHGHIKELYCNQ